MHLNHKMARWIERPSSEFVVKGTSLFKQCPAGICDLCTRKPSCSIRSDKEVKSSCASAILPISFVDQVGTGGRFNTVRLGSAWGRRLRSNDIVSLTDKHGSVYGAARVERVVVCRRDEMLRDHATMNHTMLNKPPAEAPALLWTIVSKIYKSFMKTADPEFSVIYLSRAGSRSH